MFNFLIEKTTKEDGSRSFVLVDQEYLKKRGRENATLLENNRQLVCSMGE